MKKKITKLVLMAGLVSGIAVLASCGGNNPTPTQSTPTPTTQTTPATEVKTKGTLTVHANPFNLDEVTSTLEVQFNQTAADGTKFGVPNLANPTNDYKEFVGWFKDKALTQAVNLAEGIDSDLTIYAKWNSKYEEVVSGFGQVSEGSVTSWGDLATAVGFPTNANTKFTADTEVGNFVFGTGVQLEPAKKLGEGTGVINTQSNKNITINLTGVTNEIHISGVQGASTSANAVLTIEKATVADGVTTWTSVYESDPIANGADLATPIDLVNLEAGAYRLHTSVSTRIVSITIKQKLELSPINGFEVAGTAKDDFLVNEVASLNDLIDALKVKVNVTFENGKKSSVAADDENLVIDASNVSLTESGVYNVLVKYADFDAVEVPVSMFAVDSISLGMYELNSSRVTQHVQEVYLKGQKANTNHLSIIAHGVCGDEHLDFNLPISKGAVAEGEDKLVTVTYQEKTASFQRYYLDKGTTPNVNVNPNAEAVTNTTFKTITQALQYLELLELGDTTHYYIKLAEGTYHEKVDVSLPNLTIVGANFEGFPAMEDIKTEAAKYVIEFDALAGQLDPAGKTAHSTDGSATLSVRKSATGFSLMGVTVKNAYNTHEKYAQSKLLTSDTQAVALYNEADQSAIGGCIISSYHDTLYANAGRQFYMSNYIEGRTDYIFGGGVVTAYFVDNTIHTLAGELTAEGVAKDKNGGYVACTKGSAAPFDFIFDHCTFEADETVLDGSVSLGRTWAENMRLMIMNSTISAKYSKTDFGHGVNGFNTRYTEMNKGKSPSKDKIFEFNNSGEGALTAEQMVNTAEDGTTSAFTSVSYATDAIAADHKNLVKVFNALGTTWADAWLMPALMSQGNYEAADITVDNIVVCRGLVGAIVSEKTITNMVSVPDGYILQGLYDDAAFTTKHDFSKPLTETVSLYAKLESLGEAWNTIYLYGGDNSSEWAENIAVDQSTGNKITTTTGTGDSAVTAYKISGNDNITLTMEKSKYINLEVTGFTTGSSNASDYLVIKFMNGDTVVKEVTGTTPAGKVNGSFTFGDLTKLSVKLDTEVDKVVFTCGTSGKSIGITSIDLVEYVKDDANAPFDIKAFDATKKDASYDGWTVTMANAGSAKVATTLGYDKDKKDKDGTVNDSVELVDCPKLVGVATAEGGDSITSVKFGASKKVELEMIASSTGSGDALYCYVDLLAEDGTTVVKTVKWENVSVKKLSTKAELTVESDTSFFYVRIRGCNKVKDDTLSNFNVLSINLEVTLAK